METYRAGFPRCATAIVDGRLHLTREGYGLVFDMPYAAVEQICAAEEGTSLHVA